MARYYADKQKYSPEECANRFWKRVNKTPGQGPTGDCWEWQSWIGSDGYGGFSLLRSVLHTQKAHRVSFYLEYGSLTKDTVIMHSCDNRKCVNPAHLSEGTLLDNNKDMFRKNRNKCYSAVRLTEELVIRLRTGFPYMRISSSELARRLHISISALMPALIGTTFKELPGAIPKRKPGKYLATLQEVIAIRELKKEQPQISAPRIIEVLGLKLKSRTVSAILSRESWKDVP